MITIGLTGGMGCGKTTAARFFEEEGFGTLDTDAIVHELLANDRAVRQALAERFGPAVFDEAGAVNRRWLGQQVFEDLEALGWLEALVHPRVGVIWRHEVSSQPERDWVVQIPLLFEKKLEHSVDLIVCVGASAEIQRRRLLERGSSDQDIARRLSRQLPTEEKATKADFFLLNDGSPDFLREQVQHLCRQLLRPHQIRAEH